ncbi:reverse transcriptase domain-containing protein [Tanacetum coccineum]
MRTRSSSNLVGGTSTNLNPKGRNRRRSKQRVEPFNLEEPIEDQAPPVVTMADQRIMAQLLQAPTEGYEDAIVVPEITADNFSLSMYELFYPGVSPDVAEHKDMVKALLLDKKNQSQAPATVKAVKESCVTCGSAHSHLPPPPSSLPKVVEHEPEVTKDTVQSSTEDIQPSMAQTQTQIDEPVVAQKTKPTLPYPSRINKEKIREKDDLLALKFMEIFRNLHFELSFTDALLHMPKFVPMFRKLLNNKDKIIDLVKTPMDECLALADLGASINLMTLSIWKELNLSDLTKTRMILVDYVADPRVPLILGIPFLRTARALIDVHGEQMTLRHDDQSITFKVGDTKTLSYNIIESVKRIDVIDVSCKEYAQEVLGFSDTSKSGNPTPTLEQIISTSSPTLTPFGDRDFLFEEADAFLAIEDEPISSEIDDSIYDSEGDTLYLEELLSVINSDPNLPPLPVYEINGNDKLPVIIAKNLKDEDKAALIKVLKSHKHAIAWKISNIKGIDPQFCTHKILMEENAKPAVQHQRRVNPKIYEVIKQEFIKLLDAGLIYPISDSSWLNDATRKDHFPLPFMDQILERLAGNEYYCFLDGFLGYFQIPIDPQDQEKTTFTCPYGTFAYRHMPFGLCNAPGTFQRYMMDIFHDMIEKTMEVFMEDFLVFGNSFETCLSHLDKMLQRCEDTNLVLNWEKSHFMVKEGIVLGHKISKNGIEVDKVKVNVIAKLPHPTTVKGIRSFLGNAGFYQRFIKDFSKISWPMTQLLEKDTPFFFSKECIEAFQNLKKKLIEAPILIALDWDLPFELMCDASDYAIGAVLGQRKKKHFRPIYYASKTMNEAQAHYTTKEKEMLAVVYAIEKFRSYLVLSKRIVLLLQEFDIKKTMEVFMEDFSVFGNSFKTCLSHLDKMLQRCEDTNLVLNWEKSHFMVKEGIVLGHKISKKGIEVDKVKVDVIAKLPHPTTIKGIQSFLSHAGFYQRFIKDFSKISWPMTRLLEKDTPFFFSKECIEAFQNLKKKLIEAPILISLDWDLPSELMCDESDYAIGAVLGQRKKKHFRPIYYASKTMNELKHITPRRRKKC